MNISTAVDGENLELHGKEMQNKNKNKHKVTKVPTAKLIEIAVANCKKNGHNLEIVLTYCVLKHCQYFQIEHYIRNRQSFG